MIPESESLLIIQLATLLARENPPTWICAQTSTVAVGVFVGGGVALGVSVIVGLFTNFIMTPESIVNLHGEV